MVVLQPETLQRTTIRLSGIFIKAFQAKYFFIHSFIRSFHFYFYWRRPSRVAVHSLRPTTHNFMKEAPLPLTKTAFQLTHCY